MESSTTAFSSTPCVSGGGERTAPSDARVNELIDTLRPVDEFTAADEPRIPVRKQLFEQLCSLVDPSNSYDLCQWINLTGYTDADWGSDITDRKSISGFIFVCNGPISWSSKKQQTVALSSMEAEYMAVTHAAREAYWIRHSSLSLVSLKKNQLNSTSTTKLLLLSPTTRTFIVAPSTSTSDITTFAT